MSVSGGDSATGSHRDRLLSSMIGAVYILAAALALLYTRDQIHFPDEVEYLSLGQNLLKLGLFSQDGVTPTAFRPPGWPALIAVLWWIWPSVYSIKLFNLACWAATGFAIARLSNYFYGPAGGRLGAALYLCYILELYTATTLYPQTVVGLLVTASVVLVVRTGQLTLFGQIMLLALSGFQILAVPTCIVAAAAVYLYALVKRKISLTGAIAAGCAILIVVVAWCYRNEQAIGRFTFSTNDGMMLAHGNSDRTTAAGGVSTDISELDEQTRNMTEIDRDETYRKAAISWIVAHPGEAIRLYLSKFLYWFSYANEYKTAVSIQLLGYLSLGIAVIYYSTLAGSIFAFGSREENVRGFAILAWSINIGAGLLYAIFFTRIRYRLPFDPLLFAAASGIIFTVMQKPSDPLQLPRRLDGV